MKTKKDAIPEWIAIQKKIRTNRVFHPFPESKTEHRHMESNLWKVASTHVWGRTLVTTPGSNASIGGKPRQKPDKKVQYASEEDVCCTSFFAHFTGRPISPKTLIYRELQTIFTNN